MSQMNPGRPLDIVLACRAADLPVLRLAIPALRRFVPCKGIHVFTRAKSFPRFRRALAAGVQLHDEDQAVPGMTLSELKTLPLPGFPQGAGWYFQQLLKYSFCAHDPADDFYLIWDADTIPLRPLSFFDGEGRMLFTRAEEEHPPYFDTYWALLGEKPAREFSFIAQHMVVQKSILREMLGRIEAKFPGPESWAWKIMRHLRGTSTNLFSEYETLGSYVRAHYLERAADLARPWLREGSSRVAGLPKAADLDRLAADYDFAAFESSQRPLRRNLRAVRRWWQSRLA